MVLFFKRSERLTILCLFAVLFFLASCHPAGTTKAPSPSSDPLARATDLISRGDCRGAQLSLLQVTAEIPPNWSPEVETADSISRAFWDKEEFLAYVAKNKGKKKIVWQGVPYSKAYYYLAYCQIEEKDYRRAMSLLDMALAYEPDHPVLLHEKAVVYSDLRDPQKSYDFNKLALTKRSWATDHQRAVAMRGMGYALIELGKWREAEKVYLESLKLEPNNQIATSELGYIRDMKRKKGIK